MITSTVPPSQIPLRRRGLGMLVRLGDDGSGAGEGYGPTTNYGDPTGGYSTEASDVPVPTYSTVDTSSQAQVDSSGYDPTLQAQALDTGLTLTAEGTAAIPTASQVQGTLISWGDDLGSFMEGLLGPSTHASSPIVGASGASTKTTTKPVTTPVKSAPANLPKVTPSKPKAVANEPNVNAYEALFAANLNAFMASGKTSADQSAGENYFVQEWAVFASDMNSAGSWGTTGLAQRNRGGTLDWWAKYYDPIANYLVTNAGITSSTTGASNSGLLLLVLAGVVVWWMTE